MKRLVLCCDGTWNTADQEKDETPTPTNVIRTAYRVAKRDAAGIPQVVYYDQGVGTGNSLDKFTGGAFGMGLSDNVHDAYRFLVANYEPGDQIFIFGFSRGAFTARSIGGMIRNCGILAAAHIIQYPKALALYRSNAQHPDGEAATKFREAYSCCGGDAIPIRFVGVWDTVGALGIPAGIFRSFNKKKYEFFDTELSGTVEFAYHALAIDEKRKPFEPTLWTYKPKTGQVVEQVWFCGAHSDVGGGYREKDLSDIALDWMLEKAQGAGLVLDEKVTKAYPVVGNPRGELHNSKTGMYRVTPSLHRPIGTDDPTQSIHHSVRARWDTEPEYRPENLRNYFKAIGDPRGG